MAGPRGTFGTYVVMRPASLQALLESPSGPITREMMRRGERVKLEAQRLVGVYVLPPAGPPRTRRPGTLRDSIVKRLVRQGKKVAVIVGSHDPIALWHHEGTVPHPITPHPPKRHLTFYWGPPNGPGRVVYPKAVRHPGTQPNRYLTNALGAARG